jgi:hypothetical protein
MLCGHTCTWEHLLPLLCCISYRSCPVTPIPRAADAHGITNLRSLPSFDAVRQPGRYFIFVHVWQPIEYLVIELCDCNL